MKPFDETEASNVVLQEELLVINTIEVQKFEKLLGKYPEYRKIVRKLFATFSTSYFIERRSGAVTSMLAKKEYIYLLFKTIRAATDALTWSIIKNIPVIQYKTKAKD